MTADEDQWKPTHRHIKRGGEYMMIGAAILQTDVPLADRKHVVLYKDSMGRTYARPMEEFEDGRFVCLPRCESVASHDDFE